MQAEKPNQREGWLFWARAIVLVVVVPMLLVVGYASFALQGSGTDLDSDPIQTWPFSVVSLILGGVLTWVAVRPGPLGRLQIFAVVLAAAVFGLTFLWGFAWDWP